ncbi:hypothetical protein F7725_002624 [Dissostichus mawsoni]|uniref:Uncharacterized protein n=1 Tax=Dissostichus mawsoni TaxID=36200 RepID=A0A7J5Y2W5_DISMA|nr:hypothetical protein F7725_002624 [Dissostichus mawsoni]
MAGPAVLRIIFGDQSDSVEELHTFIKTFFQLEEDFRLQYIDADFNEFMNLTSVSEIAHKSALKVIYSPILSPVEPFITLHTVESFSETSISTCPEPQTPFVISIILHPGPKLKGDILDGLAQEIMKYPKDFQCEEASEDAERDIPNTVMGIYTIRRNGDGGPEDVGIVREGIKVMENVGSVIVGLIMLLGLI